MECSPGLDITATSDLALCDVFRMSSAQCVTCINSDANARGACAADLRAAGYLNVVIAGWLAGADRPCSRIPGGAGVAPFLSDQVAFR